MRAVRKNMSGPGGPRSGKKDMVLVYALRRPRQLVEHALQVERARLLARRELGQGLDVAGDEDLGRHQQEDAVDAPAAVAHAFLVGALERIGPEVEQLRDPQG